jgi:hypothetical protein
MSCLVFLEFATKNGKKGVSLQTFFFLEYVGDLHIFVLRRKRVETPSTAKKHKTHNIRHPQHKNLI